MVYDPNLGYDPATYDPFMGSNIGGGVAAYNPQYVQGQNALATQQAQQAYDQGMLQHQNDALAFSQAQQAFTNAMSLGSAYGYAPGGNWYQFGAGGATTPPAGTPLQSTMNIMGYAGGIPGMTGFNTGQTLAAQNQYFQQAGAQAGLTGIYQAPSQSQYSPGTWVQLSQNPQDTPQDVINTQGQQLAYVLPSGQLQRVGTLQQAQSMGYVPGQTPVNTAPYTQFMALSQAPPSALPTETIAAQQQYQQLATSQQQQALAQAGVTGSYVSSPGSQMALQQQGYAVDGSNFYSQPASTQQAYMNVHHDASAAIAAWIADTNANVNNQRQQQGLTPLNYTSNYAYGQYGTPQQTLQSQQQAANIAAQQAQETGYYTAPSMYTPGSYVQDPSSGGYYQVQSGGQLLPVSGLPQGASAVQGTAGVGANAGQLGAPTVAYQQFQQQAAQSYLDLLSRLQGPADYGQYLKVLGSTPSGIQGLVGAAAGNYIPGGGATGVAPQAQTLQNLVGAATGQAGGGTGANAPTPGPQQQQGGTATASPGGMNYNDFLATAQGLPAPSQIAPQSFNQMLPSQQQMLGSMYSNLGYAPGDINKMYQQSLPKYAAGSAAGSMRLV